MGGGGTPRGRELGEEEWRGIRAFRMLRKGVLTGVLKGEMRWRDDQEWMRTPSFSSSTLTLDPLEARMMRRMSLVATAAQVRRDTLLTFGLASELGAVRSRWRMGGDRRSEMCPFGCGERETLAHLLGSCRQLHAWRTQRADVVARMIGEVVKKQAWVEKESVVVNDSRRNAGEEGLPKRMMEVLGEERGREHQIWSSVCEAVPGSLGRLR